MIVKNNTALTNIYKINYSNVRVGVAYLNFLKDVIKQT